MCPTTNEDGVSGTTGVASTDAVRAVGDIMTAFVKSGPLNEAHAAKALDQISRIIASIPVSAEKATDKYRAICEGTLADIIRVKGMPTREVGGDGSKPKLVSSSGKYIADNFDALLPAIRKRLNSCVARYDSQAAGFLAAELGQLDAMARQIIEQVPVGGSKDKGIKSQISEIKKELRPLAKWDERFYTLKASSFVSDVESLFAAQSGPIAAIWHYSKLDERNDVPKTYDHSQRDGLVFAVRDNWAITKGFMQPGPAGYLDEISQPGQELGCMCSIRRILTMGSLPWYMLTDLGQSELRRVKNIVDLEMMEAAISNRVPKAADLQNTHVPAKGETAKAGIGSRLLRWLRPG